MNPTLLTLAALVFGLLVGAGFMVALAVAERRGSNARRAATASLPDGMADVLVAVGSACVVIDPSNNVVHATDGAAALGLLVPNQLVLNPALIPIASAARREDHPVDYEVELGAERFATSQRVIAVRAGQIGARFTMISGVDHTEAHRLDAVRRDFVANISHELKTPIASASLLAEAIEHAADDPTTVRRFAKRLATESQRLAQITADVIELARLQATDVSGRTDLVSMNDVVTQAVDETRVLADGKQVVLVVRTSKGQADVLGDRAALVVAVHNLLANAINYSNAGGRVGVGVRVTPTQVEVVITDQGIGISDVELERIWERFYRVDPARARNTGGSGLGLSIVKHTVQQHQGEVQAWSRPGQGSTFTIRLPRAPGSDVDDELELTEPTRSADERPAGANPDLGAAAGPERDGTT
ncbi:MAG TPA: ATP-binding protein [Candidatus Lumbricidophila sp.]|nr:ATP-binding protein [Candidatus Lumbricidophila sp.]